MTRAEIKQDCESIYKTIEDSKNRLEELRKICKHEDKYDGIYSWRVGATCPAIICAICGKALSFPFPIQ